MTMPAQPPAPPVVPEPGAPGTITVPPSEGAFDPRTGDPVQPATPANDPNGVWGAGVQPPTPPASPGAPAVPVVVPPPGQPIQPVVVDGQTYFTAEALEQARREEREKLYGRLEEQGQQLRSVTEFVQAEQQRREAAEREAVEAAERERQASLSIEDRLREMEQTWQQRLAAQDRQMAAQAAVLEQERRLQEVEQFRVRRLSEESEAIHPSLVWTVKGSTPEEIEQSIVAAKASTDAIVADMQGLQVAQRQQMRTVAPTGAPPVSPSDNASGQQTFTAEEIRQWDPATYAKHRPALLAAVSQRAAEGRLYQP